MKQIDKKYQLQQLIEQTLTPLIDADYVLLDVPYYNNIGDVLIWEGTKDWLSSIPHKCLRVASKETFDFPDYAKDVIIILLGGGNFGDVYRPHQLFRQEVITRYPKNKIIILPQTIFYRSWHTLRSDATVLRQHRHLTICARDSYSYKLSRLFNVGKDIKLLPDMAFCIHDDKLKEMREAKGELFVKRWDSEIAPYDYNRIISDFDQVDTRDWPTYEVECPEWARLSELLQKDHIEAEKYADDIFRKACVKYGIEFINRYKKIYTTRLHAMILGALLQKDIVLFDNSYGKNADFYYTWMEDCENILLKTSLKSHIKRQKLTLKAFAKLLMRKS